MQTTRPQPKPQPPKYRDTSLPEPNVEGQEQVSPTTRLRKRQINSGDGDNGHQLKRARLTRKNLARLDGTGRKKASYKASTYDDDTGGSTTKTISTTSSGFADQARKNGILHPLHSKPPANVEDIRRRHARSRDTASPPSQHMSSTPTRSGKPPTRQPWLSRSAGSC